MDTPPAWVFEPEIYVDITETFATKVQDGPRSMSVQTVGWKKCLATS